MFKLFQSNQMPLLVESYTQRRASIETAPFSPEIVLVQNHGMGQWLKLELAQHQGIAANISAELPGTYITGLYHQFLRTPVEKESAYSRNILTWHIMDVLNSTGTANKISNPFLPLINYLDGEGDRDLRLYQLSHQLAGLYEQYLIYRPAWIHAWDKGAPGPLICQQHPWQALLWQEISRRTDERHRANLHLELLDIIDSINPTELPARVSLFGFSSLPPMHFDTFRALAEKVEVDIYFLNPCQHYWGDIVSSKDIARRSVRDLIEQTSDAALADEDYMDIGNPLLSSMGKQGREYFELLLSEESLDDATHFAPSAPNTILSLLKNDVLNLEFGGSFGAGAQPEKLPHAANDTSIRIHSCHSKSREVEVLLDQIYQRCSDDPELVPNEIIVMMPDVNEYIPHIQNIFTGKFNYNLADQPTAEYLSIVHLQLALIDLPNARLSSVEMIDLLEHPAISNKFGLSREDHRLIRRWVDAAKIRWEIDGASKHEKWQVPVDDTNTWKTGIGRLLQGIAMEQASGMWLDHLAVDVDAEETRCLGILAHFVAQIEHFRGQFSKSRLGTDWLSLLNEMNDAFFDESGPEQVLVTEIIIAAQELVDQSDTANYEQLISPRLLHHWLTTRLDLSAQGNSFINGGITFATMVPMRSIPFKVVCLLGMNDRNYPREDRTISFDLMAMDGLKKGDRSLRNDDRYLFLEAVLSAQAHLHISYEGKSIKDNSKKPASVLVGELLEYLACVSDQSFLTEHPLQPYSEKYNSPEHPELTSFNQQWQQNKAFGQHETTFISQPLEDVNEQLPGNISQLIGFLSNPAQYFFQQRLGVRFDTETDQLRETESFVQDNLEKYQLAEHALALMISGDSLHVWKQELFASGQLLKGHLGESQLKAAIHKAGTIYNNLLLEGQATIYSGYVDCGTVELTGQVENGYRDTIWNYRTGQIRKRQLLKAWIEQLFVNALGHASATRLVSTKLQSGIVKVENSFLKPVNREEATTLLSEFVDLHQKALTYPLPFLPELSGQWFESIEKNEAEAARTKKIVTAWNQDMAGSEGKNPYYTRLFDFPKDLNAEFDQLAQKIYQPLLSNWEKIK